VQLEIADGVAHFDSTRCHQRRGQPAEPARVRTNASDKKIADTPLSGCATRLSGRPDDMIYFARWKVTLILAILLWAPFLCIPIFCPPRQSGDSELDTASDGPSLGLDLQGVS